MTTENFVPKAIFLPRNQFVEQLTVTDGGEVQNSQRLTNDAQHIWSVEIADGQNGNLNGKIYLRTDDKAAPDRQFYDAVQWQLKAKGRSSYLTAQSPSFEEREVEGVKKTDLVINFVAQPIETWDEDKVKHVATPKPIDAMLRLHKMGYIKADPADTENWSLMSMAGREEKPLPEPQQSTRFSDSYPRPAKEWVNLGDNSQIEAVRFEPAAGHKAPATTITFWSKYAHGDPGASPAALGDEMTAMQQHLSAAQAQAGAPWSFESGICKQVVDTVDMQGVVTKKYQYVIKCTGRPVDGIAPDLESMRDFLDGVVVKNDRGEDTALTTRGAWHMMTKKTSASRDTQGL